MFTMTAPNGYQITCFKCFLDGYGVTYGAQSNTGLSMREALNEVYASHTNQKYETVERTLDRDYFMTAEQAKEFGLIDRVLAKRSDVNIGSSDESKSGKDAE